MVLDSEKLRPEFCQYSSLQPEYSRLLSPKYTISMETCRKRLQKQEGVIFRHLLRLILLIEELSQLNPPDLPPDQWRAELGELAERLTGSCRDVDPTSTDKALAEAKAAAEAEYS